MDNTKVFDALERKVEKLLARLRGLQDENEKLKGDLTAARKTEKDAGEARGAVERMEKDQQAVRERLQRLIDSLENAEKERS